MENKIQPKGSAQLSINGETYDLPVYGGSLGPDVIDIRALYKNAGVFTFDPGFTSTASCESQITYIDGDEGTLLYRGYPIDQLADNASFIEVAYLLQNGELPNAKELEEFDWTIRRHTMLHDQFDQFFRGFRRDAHPMAIMVGTVGALSAFYHDSTDVNDPQARLIASHRMIAKMPTIAARAYKYHIGQPFVAPQNDLDYASNFLQMWLCCPGGKIRGVSDPRPRHGQDLHPARRPRTERVDLDRASGRLFGRQSVRLHRSRHRLAVGPGPWRRERSGSEHAA